MRGELSEFTLAELLQLFALAERTGTILVTTSKRASRVLLESGRIVGIGLEDFDVHRELTACELLPARSGASLDSIKPAPATPGLSFIVRNIIEPDRWDLFSRRCLEQQVYPLLTQEQGSFAIAVERLQFCPLSVNVSVQQLVLDGSRWEAEMAEHRHDGFGLSTVWTRRGDNPESCSVTSVDWLTWAILEEPESIADVGRRVCVPDLDTTSAVRRLVAAGLVESAS